MADLELLQDLTWRSFYPKEFHLEVAGALGPPCFDDLISVNKVWIKFKSTKQITRQISFRGNNFYDYFFNFNYF